MMKLHDKAVRQNHKFDIGLILFLLSVHIKRYFILIIFFIY